MSMTHACSALLVSLIRGACVLKHINIFVIGKISGLRAITQAGLGALMSGWNGVTTEPSEIFRPFLFCFLSNIYN